VQKGKKIRNATTTTTIALTGTRGDNSFGFGWNRTYFLLLFTKEISVLTVLTMKKCTK
jgi:hypothetical protein